MERTGEYKLESGLDERFLERLKSESSTAIFYESQAFGTLTFLFEIEEQDAARTGLREPDGYFRAGRRTCGKRVGFI